MKYTPQMEQMILTQIEHEPEREIILPDWCYWTGTDACYIHRDGERIRLVYHLYEVLIGALPMGAGLSPAPGTQKRNVNPHLYSVVPKPGVRAACPIAGHEYSEQDWIPGVGHRCHACREARKSGNPSPSEINREKTHCPKGHALVKRKNGTRRCLPCPREAERERRKRMKEKQA